MRFLACCLLFLACVVSANDNSVYRFMAKDQETTRQGTAVAIGPRSLLVPFHLLGKTNEVQVKGVWIAVMVSRSDDEFDVALLSVPQETSPLVDYSQLTRTNPDDPLKIVAYNEDGKKIEQDAKPRERLGIKRVLITEKASFGASGSGVFFTKGDKECAGIVTGLVVLTSDGTVVGNSVVMLPARRIWQFLNE